MAEGTPYVFRYSAPFGIHDYEDHLRKTKKEKPMHYEFFFGSNQKYKVHFKSVQDAPSTWTVGMNDKAEKSYSSDKTEYARILSTMKECITRFAKAEVDDLTEDDIETLTVQVEWKDGKEQEKLFENNLYKKINIQNFSKFKDHSESSEEMMIILDKD